MPDFSRTLNRQLRKLKLSAITTPPSSEVWAGFLQSVDTCYREFQLHQELSRHADLIAAKELEQVMSSMQQECDALRSVIQDRGQELQQVRELTGVGSFRYDCGTGMVTISEGLGRILGHGSVTKVVCYDDFLGVILPSDRARFAQLANSLFTNLGSQEIDLAVQKQGGDTVYLNCRLDSQKNRNAKRNNIRGAVMDVTDQKMSIVKIQHMAYFDELTGLANRVQFIETLNHALVGGEAKYNHFAIAFLDLDGFKEINDTLGHDSGDELLRQVAERINHTLRDDDLVARFGGDEFVMLLPRCKKSPRASALIERLLKALSSPISVSGCEVRVSGSVGLSFYPEDGTQSKDLLKRADMAMYLAKSRGRNRMACYEPQLSEAGLERLQTLKEIRDGLERGEFEPFYQPIVDGETGKILGVEALARWRHPIKGLVGPGVFIEIAEQHGLIDMLGDVVLYRGARQLSLWRDMGLTDIYLSVNLSPSQLTKHDLISTVRQVIEMYCLPPSSVQFEITESTAMKDKVKGLQMLHDLSAMGVRLALDDFGTGYSSLATLQDFPIHVVKLDRSFVSPIKHEAQQVPILAAVSALARTYGFDLVAEGVETQSQRQRLLDYGYQVHQGFLYHKPLPTDILETMLLKQARLNQAENTSVSTSPCAATV